MKKLTALLFVCLLLLANVSSAVILLDGNIPPGCTVASGVLTCTGFVGDGSGLTDVPSDGNDTEINRLIDTAVGGGTLDFSGTTGTFSGAVTASQFDVTRTTDPQQVQLYEGTGDGNESVTIVAGAMSADATITISGGQVNLGALNLITTGKINGYLNVVNKSDNATLTTAETSGSLVVVSAAKTITLPAVAIGNSACVYSSGANVVEVRPNASDGFVLAGAARDTDGQGIYSDGTAGAYVCFFGDSADGWTTLGSKGTWTSR